MNGTTMGLRIASRYLCIQIAIDKMQLCSLSVAYARPYPNPTMGHSVHNVDISKPLAHTMLYTLTAICPVQLKPGFIREEHTSPSRVPVAIEGEHLPTEFGYDEYLQSGQDPDEDDEHADELP